MLSTSDIIRNAARVGLALPAFNIPYLPMMEPVVHAVADQDSFALVAVARLEWIKFEAESLGRYTRSLQAGPARPCPASPGPRAGD